MPGSKATAVYDFKICNNVKCVRVMSYVKTEVEVTHETSCGLCELEVRRRAVFKETSVRSACVSLLPLKLIYYLQTVVIRTELKATYGLAFTFGSLNLNTCFNFRRSYSISIVVRGSFITAITL